MKITVLDFYAADYTPPAQNATTPTYGTPEKLSGSADVQVAYNKSPVKVYESGKACFNKTYVADAKVTLQTHTMELAKRKELFYSLTPEDEIYEEGGDSDTPKDVAIGWAALLSDGKYLCTWFLKASAAPADESYKTSTESGPQVEPDTIEFSCIKRDGDNLLRRTKICDNAAAMATFFAAVEPADETP